MTNCVLEITWNFQFTRELLPNVIGYVINLSVCGGWCLVGIPHSRFFHLFVWYKHGAIATVRLICLVSRNT